MSRVLHCWQHLRVGGDMGRGIRLGMRANNDGQRQRRGPTTTASMPVTFLASVQECTRAAWNSVQVPGSPGDGPRDCDISSDSNYSIVNGRPHGLPAAFPAHNKTLRLLPGLFPWVYACCANPIPHRKTRIVPVLIHSYTIRITRITDHPDPGPPGPRDPGPLFASLTPSTATGS